MAASTNAIEQQNESDDEDFVVAMFIEEPFDPTKVPMYCKNKIYDNGQEFSLEEIRARRYVAADQENLNIKKVFPLELHHQPIETQLKAAFSFENLSMNDLWSSPVMKKPVIPEDLLVKGKQQVFDYGHLSLENKENPTSLKNPCDKENHPLVQNLLPARNIPSAVPIKPNKEKEIPNQIVAYGSKEGRDFPSESEDVFLKPSTNFDLDVTSYTKAFNMPVTSSTPFVGGKNALRKENGRDLIGVGKASIENMETIYEPGVGIIKELSVIEESSKECMSGSNGTGSGTPASTADSEHPLNPVMADNANASIVCHNTSRISSIMTGGNVESKRSQNSRIPCAVSRVQSKETAFKSASKIIKEMVTDQKPLKETRELSIGKDRTNNDSKDCVVGSLEKFCKQFEELVITEDPFESDVTSQLLQTVKVPVTKMKGFYSIPYRLPTFKVNSNLQFRQDLGDGGHVLKSLKVIGQGAYAKVYKALSSKWQRSVAVKVQKPPCEWEFYISHEIQERITDSKMKNSFMNVKEACFFLDGSALVSDFMEYGTLLDVINLYKIRRSKLPEVLAVYFTMDVLRIVNCLHSCHIIHGDIKPDNFLLKRIPATTPNLSVSGEPLLQLIDLGRCIDMSLFPENTRFSMVFQKTFFQCIEMRTKKPWTYQIDLFNIASLVHCLVFGDFMDVYCKDGIWNVSKKVPRNMNQALWNWLFNTLLNIESCFNLPNLNEIIEKIEKYFLPPMQNEVLPAITSITKLLNEEKSKQK